MKNLNNFENYQNLNQFRTNESLALPIITGVTLVLATPLIYEWGKKFWSKLVVGSKYKKTGKTEVLSVNLPETKSGVLMRGPVDIRKRRKKLDDGGSVVTSRIQVLMEEYQDPMGNLFWGIDHIWNPSDNYKSRFDRNVASDIYTAMYKAEDYDKVKRYFQDPKKYTGGPEFEKPQVIDMIYLREQ